MAGNNTAQFRPRITGNQATDEGFRKAFDYIYSLKNNMNAVPAIAANAANIAAAGVLAASNSGGGGGGGGNNNSLAPDPTSVSATITYSDNNTGAQFWGANITIAAPTGGWNGTSTVQIDAVRVSPGNFLSTLGVTDKIPTGNSSLIYTQPPEFVRPVFGSNEVWQFAATDIDRFGVPANTINSNNYTVIGGGSATPAPNVTAIANTILYDGTMFSVRSNFTLPANYAFINQMDMRVQAFLQSNNTVLDADNDIGVVNSFDFVAPAFNNSTNIFTFTHGPYQRPDPGTGSQDWAVGARVASGVGVWTASPFYSSHFAVTEPGAPGNVTATITYSNNNTGAIYWGVDLVVAAPGGGWNNNTAALQVNAVRTSPAGFQNTLFISYTLPAGNNNFTTSVVPDFARPPFGSNETWQFVAIPIDGSGVAGPSSSSANTTVVGGGSSSAAPNITSVTNNYAPLNDQFFVTSVFQFPTNFANINFADMRVRAYTLGSNTSIDADNDIGRIDFFDFPAGNNTANWNYVTRQFTFKHGPYLIGANDQYWDVGMRTYSGIGVVTANATFSPQFLVSANWTYTKPLVLASAGAIKTFAGNNNSVQLTYDPTNGLKVTDTVNGQITQMLARGLSISGSGNLSGSAGNMQSEFASFLSTTGHTATISAHSSLLSLYDATFSHLFQLYADHSANRTVLDLGAAPLDFINGGNIQINGTSVFDNTGISILTANVNAVLSAWTPGNNSVGWEVKTIGFTTYRSPLYF